MSGQTIYNNNVICNGNVVTNQSLNYDKIFGFFTSNDTDFSTNSSLTWKTTPDGYSSGITLSNNSEFTFDKTGIFLLQYTLNIDNPSGNYYELQIQLQSQENGGSSWNTVSTNYSNQYYTTQAEISNFFQIDNTVSKSYRLVVSYTGYPETLRIASNFRYTNLFIFRIA